MALDKDIDAMNKNQLQAQLRALKAGGTKVNVSGNVLQLKQRLQDARDKGTAVVQTTGASGVIQPLNPSLTLDTTSAPSAHQPTPGVTTPGTVPPTPSDVGAGIEEVLLNYSDLHPLTAECAAKLGVTFPVDNDLADDLSVALTGTLSPKETEELASALRPVVRLVDEVVATRESLSTSLNSSAAINFELLGRSLRRRMPHTVIPHAASPLFETFGLSVEIGDQVDTEAPTRGVEMTEESQIIAATQASIDTLQAEMRARHEEEIREAERERLRSSQEDYSRRATTPGLKAPEGAMDVDLTEKKEEKRAIQKQILIIQQALLFCLRDWMDEFPAPDKRLWPVDYDKEEVKNVKAFVRAWVREDSNKVDLTLHKQPDSKADEAANAIVTDDKFPVADAKTIDTIKAVLRSECLAIYNTNLRAAARKELKGHSTGEDDGDLSDSEGESQADGSGLAGTGLRGQKRARASDGGSTVDDPGTFKKQKTAGLSYGGGGVECMACFFADAPCELAVRNDPGRLCPSCFGEGEPCRLLCDECADIANAAGRGSGAQHLLLAICSNCEYRQG